MGQRLALIIGNSVYNDRAFTRLQKAKVDASRMAKVLGDQNIGGFKVNQLIDENIEIIKREIEQFFQKGERDDFLLLYFSGHGNAENKLNNLYLIGKNTRSNAYATTAISSHFIKEVVASSRSRTKVLVLDCCNSGAYILGGKGKPQTSEAIAPLVAGIGHAVLTASSASELAWEGKRNTPLSLFTHYLVEGLETGKADRSNTGRITVDDWYDYAYTRVIDENPEQTPSRQIELQQGPLTIARNPVLKNPSFLSEPFSSPTELSVPPNLFSPLPLDPKQLKLRQTLIGHFGPINSLAMSPDGQTLVSSGSDNTVKVWNISTGRLLRTLTEHSEEVDALAISPDGQILVSGSSEDRNLNIWDLPTGKLRHTFLSHSFGGITALIISPDGQMIISSGYNDDGIKMWDISTGNLWRTIHAHDKGATFLAMTPDGKKLISARKRINIWDLNSNVRFPKTLNSWDDIYGRLVTLAMSPDGQFIVSYHAKGQHASNVHRWGIATEEVNSNMKGDFKGLSVPIISPDGQISVTGWRDGSIKLWRCGSSILLHTLIGHSDTINALAINPDGQTIISGSKDTTIKVWSTK